MTDGEALAKTRRLSPEALLELASRVNLFEPSTEAARVLPMPKRRGYRETFDRSRADRIARTMIRLALDSVPWLWGKAKHISKINSLDVIWWAALDSNQ